MSQEIFKGVVKLTQTQYEELKQNGTITVEQQTITYSPSDTVYVVEDNISEQVETNTNNITQLQTNISDLETDMTYKLDKNQGAENTGKFLGVDESGNTTPTELPTNKLIGTEENPIILSTDIEEGKSYFLGGYYKNYPQDSTIYNIAGNKLVECSGIGINPDGSHIIYVKGCSLSDTDSQNEARFQNRNFVEEISFNANQNGTMVFRNCGISSINSNNINIGSIYAPTTSGTAGQVLQSTGGEPEWVDLNIEPTALDMTNSTISSIPESTVDYWQLKNSDSVIQIGVANPTGESSFIALQDNLNLNNSQIQFGIGNFSTNNYANIDIDTVSGSKNITLSVQNGTSKQILTMTPTQTTLGNETEAGDVLTTLTGVKKPSIEEVSISVSSWTALSDSSPYTYQATITLSTVISSSSTVELINNQPVLFANYGFAIANISGQTATIYSVEQPSTNVTLTLEVTV